MTGARHVVMFSGGITSWKTANIVIERHGPDGVVLLFSDVNNEDDDLHRFNKEATALLGVELTRVADPAERDPWDVFFDERFLGNSRLAPCSYTLKQLPAHRWLEENADPATTTVYVGLGWDEAARLSTVVAGYAHTLGRCADRKLCRTLFTRDGRIPGPGCRNLRAIPWRVELPLMQPPYHDKQHLIAEAGALGLAAPDMYREGYQHNNCGGTCVRAGQANWALTLRLHPTRYAHAEGKENQFRREINAEATILRDWSAGGRPLPLTEFRERIEARDASQPAMFDDDWGGCGCFTSEAS